MLGLLLEYKTNMVEKYNKAIQMDEKKERILKSAEKLFARFGFRKTTMDEIARDTRMGKSTLYYYFKSKENVLEAVIQKDSRLYRKKLREAVSGISSPQEKIKNYVLTRMKHFQDLGLYYSSLTDEFFEYYAFVERSRKDFMEFEIGTLKMLIEEGIAQGVFSVEEVETTARNFSIVLKGLEYPLLIKNKDSDIEKECIQMMTILFKGIEVR